MRLAEPDACLVIGERADMAVAVVVRTSAKSRRTTKTLPRALAIRLAALGLVELKRRASWGAVFTITDAGRKAEKDGRARRARERRSLRRTG